MSKQLAYVRTEMLPQQTPPVTSVGMLGWLRGNLFSGWLNTGLTLISLVAIIMVLSAVVPWVLSPTWQATSLTECRGILHELGRDGHFSGACWGVIRDRWVQLFFGFYPADLYWRPILAFLLLAVALAPILFSDKVPAKLLWFSAAFPLLFPWLLWGGAFWGPLLILAGLVLAYLVFLQVSRASSTLPGLIAAVIFAAAWFLWGMGLITGAINYGLGSARMEGTRAALELRVDGLETREAEIDQAIASAQDAVREVMSGEAEAVASGDGAYRALIARAAAPRDRLNTLQSEKALLDEALFSAQSLLGRIEVLKGQEEALPRLKQEAEAARAALPRTVRKIDTDIGLEALKQRILSGEAKVPAEDMAQLDRVLGLETNLRSVILAIDRTYADVAMIGLRPVTSRDFGGMMLSITIGVVAIACSLPLGILLALGRRSDMMIVKYLCVGFIEFIRGVPLITLLFVASTLLNIFMPPDTKFDIILRVLIMVTLFASAYMAEVIRGGLAALPKGQYEGADSLGLNYWQAQRLVIMPQALKISIPGIVSTFIGVFKDTTLVSIIGLLDPLGLSNSIRADANWNGIVWELYGFIALIFFLFCFGMSRYSMYLERKLQTGHR
ncbi:hypothetical protein GCM10010961_31190 [Pseudodonghicola xiamenensis]|uniref:ABC transmembrane type-1 domain-containing protein n=1 Tax=Pseudodonghicola xiamenensis TaxID=337702 RepID=A0A8J3HAD0_9RHOB|nr:ABC transporter permease subunit [Pseudodonghicola xiamenensis]GHG96727.1 hypothetical protein GCM10010961_31190 [Pseudodonghicola xiamenensis]